MITKISEQTFNDKTQNSDRELFDVDAFRLIDGDSYEGDELVRSYFLFDDSNNTIYELSLKDAYDLLSLYADKDVEEGVLYEDILALINQK
jgi:hypothetical protein